MNVIGTRKTNLIKENLCYMAGVLLLRKKKSVLGLLKTATDVLRVATYLSDGDISLAANTKFKSLPRRIRRELVAVLNNVATEEDIARHAGKWIRLFHSLHVGEYGSEKLYQIAKKVRNNEHITTFNGAVEEALECNDLATAIELLCQRPGDFARRLDHLLRIAGYGKYTLTQRAVVSAFGNVISLVPTRILLQILGNLKTRSEHVTSKCVFPKGNVQKATIVPANIAPLDASIISKVRETIESALITRFSNDLPSLGKVWIDPMLKDCPLPTQQRSASEGLFQVARGTKLPFGDDNTLRFFIYWKGQDIDLSATLHDQDFNEIDHVSFTNLKSGEFQACHSGDVLRAPNGASEFIDITVDAAARQGARYVVMQVHIFSGPRTFAEHEVCYAGWMTRSKPKSNEIYDPKTVVQKIDVRSEASTAVPVIFDLVERKTIWTDLTHFGGFHHHHYIGDLADHRDINGRANMIESCRASTRQMLDAMINMNNKVSLYELFALHTNARGTLVETKEEADTVFSMYEGITPYNITEINSEYLV